MRLLTTLTARDRAVRVELDAGDGLVLYLDDRLLGASRTEPIHVRLLDGEVPDDLDGLRVRGSVRNVTIDEQLEPHANARLHHDVSLAGPDASGSKRDRLEIGWTMKPRRPLPARTRWFERHVTTGTLDARALGLGGFMPDVVPHLEPDALRWWHPSRGRHPAEPHPAGNCGDDPDDLAVIDGEHLHVFTAAGTFRQTVQRLRGHVVHRSTNDDHERPTTWTKGSLTYEAAHHSPTEVVITSPAGVWVALTLDDGRVVQARNHAEATVHFDYDANGALVRTVSAVGLRTDIERDATGAVSAVSDNAGRRFDVIDTAVATGREVRVVSAADRETLHRTETAEAGTIVETRTCCGAAAPRVVERRGDRMRAVAPDGTVTTHQVRRSAPSSSGATTLETSTVLAPSGRALRSERRITRSGTMVTEQIQVGSRSWSRVLDRSTKTLTATSPSGRRQMSHLVPNQSLTVETPDMAELTIHYDEQNLPTRVAFGELERTSGFDEHGRMSWTEVAGVRRSLVHDVRGLIVGIETGDGWLRFDRNAEGLIEAITAPTGARTDFERNLLGAITAERSPGGTRELRYDADGLLVEIRVPDMAPVKLQRDGLGRIMRRHGGSVDVETSFDPASGNVTSIGSGECRTTFRFDGDMEWSEAATGPAPGSVERIFDEHHQIVAERINGEHELVLRRTLDNELHSIGPVSLERHLQSGRVQVRRIGTVTTETSYDPLGRARQTTTTAGDALVLDQVVSYGPAGRIQTIVETDPSGSRTIAYRYDEAGRLTSASIDDRPALGAEYDANGNATRIERPGGTDVYQFDMADRILTRNGVDADYDGAGNVIGLGDDRFGFDDLWRFRRAEVGSSRVEHTLDGRNRSVVVEGSTGVARLLWDGTRCAANLDADGRVTQRFVHSRTQPAADAMVVGAATYALIADVQGSVRRVVDVDSGKIVQALDYDPFGRVMSDSAPGFQPFGFAGGLHDAGTGTVTFGARTYCTRSGRFLSKDPLGFEGGQTNLYQYAHGDPVNFADPSGLQSTPSGDVSVCTDPFIGSRPLSVDHAYLKGPGFSRGMGDTSGTVLDVEWQDEGHRGEEQCRRVRNVDPTCVEEMTRPGTPLGTYMINFSLNGGQGLANTCYDAVWDVLNTCSGPTGWEYEESFIEEPEGPGYLETIGRIGSFITTPLDWAATAIKAFIWAS